MSKKVLSVADIEAQTALDLPYREMMQLTLPVIVVPGGLINVDVRNVTVHVDLQNNVICVNVAAIDSQAHC